MSKSALLSAQGDDLIVTTNSAATKLVVCNGIEGIKSYKSSNLANPDLDKVGFRNTLIFALEPLPN
jgi:hypothetical protein